MIEEFPEQSDDVHGRVIGWTLAITVLAIGTCAVVVWALFAFHVAPDGASNVKHIELVPPAQPFSETMQPERDRNATRSDLDRWTWADRSTRRVRMPVDAAIDRYLHPRGGR